MHTFALFIHDQRYSVPTLQLVLAGTEALACELARKELLASPHHLSIELYDERGAALCEQHSAG